MECEYNSQLDQGSRRGHRFQLELPCPPPPGRRKRGILGLLAIVLMPFWSTPAAAQDILHFEWDGNPWVNVAESAGLLTLAIVRSGGNSQQLTVTFEIVADTATAGVDFIATTGEMLWLPGESRKAITVPIVNDSITEQTEFFTVRLTGVNYGGLLAVPNVMTVAIKDNDPGAHFGQHFYRIPERAGALTVNVFRGDDGNTTRNLHYRTEDGTALGGVDFETTAGDLVFGPGQVYLPLTLQLKADDSAVESIKTFRLLLSDANDPDNVTAIATVQIDDDDVAIFSADDYVSLLARSGVVRVPIRREQALSWPASVRFETAEMPGSSSARPGIDFTPVSGQLDFAAGETLGYVEIPVLDPEREEWDYRPLTLRLSELSENTRVDRTEIIVQITFGPEETAPPGQPADRVYGYPNRIAEALTPDGKFLLIGTSDGSYLWHLPTGRLIQQFDSGYTTQVSVSADGSQIATSDGQRIALWNLGGQQARQTLYATSRGLNFSPDGSQLIATSWEGRLKVFETSNPAPWRSLPDRDVGEGTRLIRMISPSGRWMMADAGDLATVWDLKTGGIALALPAGYDPGFAISPDETRLLVTSEGQAELWDLETHARLGRFPGVTGGALAHYANRVALARPGQLEVLTSGGEQLWKTNFSTTLRAVALSPDGRHLAAIFAPDDGSYYRHNLRLWNLETGAEFASTSDFVTAIQFSPDSRALMLNGEVAGVLGGSNVGTIAAFDTVSQQVLWHHSLIGYASGPVAFSPDSTRVVLPTFRGMEVRQMTDGLVASTWPVTDGNAPTGLGWSPEGITEVAFETIRLRNSTAPHELLAERPFALGIRGSDLPIVSQLAGRAELWFRQLYGSHSLLIDSTSLEVTHRFNLALSPQAIGGSLFATVEPGGSHITLFQRATGQRLRSFDIEGLAWHAALSPDDQLLLVNQYYNPSPDIHLGLVRALNANDGRELWRRELAGLSGHFPLFATTQPGRFVVSSSGSGIIHLQDVTHSEPVASVGGHGALLRLDLLPDGQHALAYMRSALRLAEPGALLGDAAFHLALWNLPAGQIERLIEGADHTLSSDGRRLLVRDRVSQTSWSLEDPVTGTRLHTWRSTVQENYWQMILSPDGHYVAARGTANNQWMLWLWHAGSGELVWRKSYDQSFVGQIAFAPDSQKLLVDLGLSERELLPVTGLAGLPIPGEGTAQFSPDGSRLLIRDDHAALYDSQTGTSIVVLDHIPSFRVNNGVFSADSQTLYLSVSQGDWRVPDHLLAVNTTTGEILGEAPLSANHPRMAALADEHALLVSGFGGTTLSDSQGKPLLLLTPGSLLPGARMNSSQVALAVGAGKFGIWDLRYVFNHRLRVLAAPTGMQLDWRDGTLQWAPEVFGPWSDLPGARGPWTVPTTGERAYFRIKSSSWTKAYKTPQAP